MKLVYLFAATEGGESAAEAPNPILPATNEVFWGVVSFALLLLIMYKYAFPAVQKTMEARTNKIRGNLDEAEQAKAEASAILEDYQRQLANAKNEANRIIEEARQTADQLRQDLIARAEAEAAELRRRSQEEIETAKERTMTDLRSEVAGLAVDLAEKVVERNLDHDTNVAMIENYIREVGSQRA